MPKELRIGILCDTLVFQRWQAECVRRVISVPGVRLVLVVLHDKPAAKPKPWLERMRQHPWRMALYLWWRRNRFKPEACEAVDLTRELADVPRIACRPLQQKGAQHFDREDLAAMAVYRPDVLLRFGFNILRGDVLDLPRFGVWSYHHGDEEHYRGQPPGFWEIVDESPVTGAILQRLTDKLDGGHILRKGWFRTDNGSLETTLNTVMMGSSGWMADVCKGLLTGDATAAQGTLSATQAAIRKYPGNAVFLEFLLKCRRHRSQAKQSASSLRDEWNIGILYQPVHALLENKPSLNIRWLPAPGQGQSRAHPSGYMIQDQLNVLYEKLDTSTGRTVVSRLRPKRDNILKRSRTMLASEGSLTHPCVVPHGGDHFVVVNDDADKTVHLCRVDTANNAIERIQPLLAEPLLSPTLFEHAGRWWLFGTRAPLENEELYIYSSLDLRGHYVPHRLGVVKCDIRSARPAGAPFVHEGQLYRPAQDHSMTSGWRVSLMRITELSTDRFQEELAKTIGPAKGGQWSHGLRTIHAVGGLTIVEGKRPVPLRAPTSERGGGRRSRSRSAANVEEEDDDE